MMQQNRKMWSNFVCPLGPFSLYQSHIYIYMHYAHRHTHTQLHKIAYVIRLFLLSLLLFRSTNYGRSFSIQSFKFPQGFVLDSIAYKSPNNRAISLNVIAMCIEYMAVCVSFIPVHQLIIIDALRSTIYVRTNDGLIFSRYNIIVNPRTMKVHAWMVVRT